MQQNASSLPAGWRRGIWLAVLVTAGIAFTFIFACAVPFAAFAAAAALTLSRRDGLWLICAVWLANQVLGYALLDYPWTANSAAWGVALLVVAVLTAFVARAAAGRYERMGPVAAGLAAFVAGFAVFEGVVYILAASPLGGMEDMAPAIVAQVLVLNGVAFLGLIALHRLGAAIGFAAPRGLAAPAVGGRA